MKYRTCSQLAFFLIFFFSAHAQCLAQPKKYSKEVEEKIIRVENNLISWVQLDSSSNWNIYRRMKDLGVNGVSIAVINDYKIEWVKSYGWADTLKKQILTDSTLFQSASIGKSINGFAFMMLVKSKKIDLYRDINSYLKSWKFPYDTASHGQKIYLAHLLSHTGGLSVHGFDGYKWNEALPSLTQILNAEKPANNPPVRSVYEPGIKFEYSGGGYQISELLLQDVTGKTYEAYIKNQIFKPLKMIHSTYTLHPAGPVATAYRFDGKDINCPYHLYPEKACGAGLWTTATDLAKFVIEIQLSLAGTSKTGLTKDLASRMLTPYISSSNAGFGFFIDKKGTDHYFQHSGLNEGFSSQYYGSMKGGKGVVVLVNSDNTSFKDEIVNSVATVYGWKDFYAFVPKKIVSVPEKTLSQYVGKYRFENEETGPVITNENGVLYLQAPGAPKKWRMYFTSPTEFFMLEARWANQQFFMDENGRVKGHYILGHEYKAKVNKVE